MLHTSTDMVSPGWVLRVVNRFPQVHTTLMSWYSGWVAFFMSLSCSVVRVAIVGPAPGAGPGVNRSAAQW